MRSLFSTAMLLLCPAWCLAQASVASSCLAESDAPAAAPIVSAAMASQFAAIRQCIADEDGDCAEDALDAIDDDELSDDELAVYWLASGDMENLQGSSRRARREYRRVVGQRDGNRQLVVSAIERTAIRYIEDDNYDNAADALEDVQCGEWTPALVYLRARAHFGEAEFSDAEATIRLAVDAQEASGERVPALWRRFLTVSATRAEQAANAQVICRDEKPSGSHIPIRICTTSAQRDAEAASASGFFGDNTAFEIEPL